MSLVQWIVEQFPTRECTSVEFMYDQMDSQSGRSLPVIYRPLDVGRGSDWHDEGCVLDFACSMGSASPDVLDFGPGDGWPSLRIAPFVQQMVGVDTSGRRIDECRRNARRLRIANAEFVHIRDERELPFDDESFDGITAASSVEQTDDPAATIRELCRVLKPGGRLRISYEGLQRYRGLEERIGWIHRHDGASAIDLYDRDIDNERALMVRVSTRLQAGELAERLGAPPAESFKLERLSQRALNRIEDSIKEIRACRLAHPSGKSFVSLCTDAGFHSAEGTWNGGEMARRLFESRSRARRPRTHAELSERLLPVIESVIGLAAPIDRDPWITAIK